METGNGFYYVKVKLLFLLTKLPFYHVFFNYMVKRQPLRARVLKNTSENKIETHPEPVICVRVIAKRNLGSNNTNSGSKYYMISPRK